MCVQHVGCVGNCLAGRLLVACSGHGARPSCCDVLVAKRCWWRRAVLLPGVVEWAEGEPTGWLAGWLLLLYLRLGGGG